jgi:hypothetical protein
MVVLMFGLVIAQHHNTDEETASDFMDRWLANASHQEIQFLRMYLFTAFSLLMAGWGLASVGSASPSLAA